MVDDFLVGRLAEKRFVCVNTIAREPSYICFWYVSLYVFEEFRRGLLGDYLGVEDLRSQAAVSVGPCAPFSLCLLVHAILKSDGGYYHLVHCFFGLLDHRTPSFLLQHVQIAVGYDAEDFDYNIIIDIEASHLQAVNLYISCNLRLGRRTSQSIHTSRWLSFNSAILKFDSSCFVYSGIAVFFTSSRTKHSLKSRFQRVGPRDSAPVARDWVLLPRLHFYLLSQEAPSLLRLPMPFNLPVF